MAVLSRLPACCGLNSQECGFWGDFELRGKEPKNRLNCTVFGYPSRSNLSCSGYKHLGFSAWKVRRPLQSEQGLWLTPQCGEVFSIPTELSLNGFQQKVNDSESTKVSLACIGGRAPGALCLGAGS